MWFKGCFHLHTTNSDGELNPIDVYNYYKDKGYDFIAITDHKFFTKLEKKPDKDLLVIENSIEFDIGTNLHILGIGLKNNIYNDQKNHQEIIDFIIKNKGIAIICHPNWMWAGKFNKLSKLKRYHGIEIFNSLIKEHIGSPFALEKWDYLLSQGNKIWGFAVEDFHYIKENIIFRGWIMVNARRLTKKDIFDSIISGNFYCSTGVVLNECFINENKFQVSSQNGEEIVFIGDNGKIIKVIDGKKGEIKIDMEYKYLRCEVRSEEGIAYTQPIFIGKE